MNKHFQLIEALLYIQGENGLTSKQLQSITGFDKLRIDNLLKSFSDYFNKLHRGLNVVCFNHTYYYVTKEEFADAIKQLNNEKITKKLSNASLETLAIIAYNQPISKSQINEIRGIASEAIVNVLLSKQLICEKAVAETIGHPILYGVTDKFFRYFGIKTLDEMPALDSFPNNEEESNENFDLFNSQREVNEL